MAASGTPSPIGMVSGLRRPNFVCADRDGNLYVTETGEVGVLLVSPNGDSRRRIGDAAKPPPGQPSASKVVYARIQGGKGIAVFDDLPGGVRRRRLFVADSVANKVFVMDAVTGELLSEFGGYGSKPGMLHHPVGLCITWRKTILVSERLNRRVQEFTITGELMRVIAIPGPVPTPSDGYLWGEPRGVATCARGNIYIVDTAQRTRLGRVLVYDTNGNLVRCIGPNISGRYMGSSHRIVEGEVIDATSVAMLNSDTLLLSHCFRPAPSTSSEGASDTAGIRHVISEFSTCTGAWKTFHGLDDGAAQPQHALHGTSGLAVSSSSGKIIALDNSRLVLLPWGTQFPIHKMGWLRERVLWLGALKGSNNCFLSWLPQDGTQFTCFTSTKVQILTPAERCRKRQSPYPHTHY
jgi:hypothetical protein